MGTTAVSFFTPIQYGNQPISLPQKLMEFVDAYFHLRGRVALVVSGKTIDGSQGVQLQPEQAFGMHSVLKVMSYTACFFNLLIITQFPTITAYRSVVLLQMILNSLPIFMLIAKVIVRSTYRFHYEYPIDLIPEQVKAILDNLLGSPGSVDRLPVYQGDPNKLDIDKLTHPIMKGIGIDPVSKKRNGFIAIKMRCLSTLEEVKQKFHFNSEYVSEPIEDVVVLRQGFIENPLGWKQDQCSRISAKFFNRHFTYIEDGQLAKDQTEAFGLLQHLIKEGSGEDSNGLRWEIFGHPKNLVS